MSTLFGERVWRGELSRRDFLWLIGASSATVAVSSISGCATDPVTGESTLMLMSEEQERQLDKQAAPHQFSADYGAVQDRALNRYIESVGSSIAGISHRPNMPYNYRAVNATYVNAYTFPAGSMAITRGILADMETEAELAGLLGHEIGHVNARHAAERYSKSALTQGLLAVGGAAAGSYGSLVQGLGGIGAGALLANYSRDNEREADKLGMTYMLQGGHNPKGMVDLMALLRETEKRSPGTIERMFSSHPMSSERYDTAVKRLGRDQFQAAAAQRQNRERYMDNIRSIRRIKPAIEAMQKAETAMRKKRFDEANAQMRSALKTAPRDYAANLLMGKLRLAQNKPRDAARYVDNARAIYPAEAQAHNLDGIVAIKRKDYEHALQAFQRYEKALPGNANTVFFKGFSYEGMQNKRNAADQYQQYLRSTQSGKQAQHAYQRLVSWGYVKTK